MTDASTWALVFSGISAVGIVLGIIGAILVVGRRDQQLTAAIDRATEDRTEFKSFRVSTDHDLNGLREVTAQLIAATSQLANADTHTLKSVCRLEDDLHAVAERLREVEIGHAQQKERARLVNPS